MNFRKAMQSVLLPDLRRPLFCATAVVVVVASTSTAQDSADPVVVRPVVVREVHTSRRVVGDVMPLRRSTIGSAIAGRVEAVMVDHGDAVKQGQALARLRTKTLKIELGAAQAELRLADQQLAELKNGALPEEIAEARANMLAAKAANSNAASALRRAQRLRNTNTFTQDEYDDAVEQAEVARQLLLAAEAMLKRIEDGPRAERIAQADSTVSLKQQQVALIEDRITKHTIIAPFNGFVAAEFTEVGAWIQQGDPIAEVIQLSKVEVRVPVAAEQAIQLTPGRSIRVEFPERRGELFVGTLKHIVPTADARTRTFPVYIELDNPIENGVPKLMAGMLARVELPTGSRQALPLVPKDSIVLNGSSKVVLVVDGASKQGQSGTVRSVPVELGVADGPLIQVTGNLKDGDLAVVLGNERLNDGNRVTIARVESDSKTRTTARRDDDLSSTPGGG